MGKNPKITPASNTGNAMPQPRWRVSAAIPTAMSADVVNQIKSCTQAAYGGNSRHLRP